MSSDESYNPNQEKKHFINTATTKPLSQRGPEAYKQVEHPNANLKGEYDPLQDEPTERKASLVRVVRNDTVNNDIMSINKQKVYKYCPHCGESLQS